MRYCAEDSGILPVSPSAVFKTAEVIVVLKVVLQIVNDIKRSFTLLVGLFLGIVTSQAEFRGNSNLKSISNLNLNQFDRLREGVLS